MADEADTKPAGGDGETITIRVRDQTGEEVRSERLSTWKDDFRAIPGQYASWSRVSVAKNASCLS